MAKLWGPKRRAAGLLQENCLCSVVFRETPRIILCKEHMWCYLKCVRCLWMSRSRMGVGLEEPRGERSWLSKSWNSLQICLTDRRREGVREGLPAVSNTTVTTCFLLPSSSFWINPHVNSSWETLEGSRSRTSSMAKWVFNIGLRFLGGFLSVLKSSLWRLSWKRVAAFTPQLVRYSTVNAAHIVKIQVQ